MKKLLIIFFTFLNLVVFSQTATEFGKTYGDEPWKTYDKKKHWWYFNRDRLGITTITFIAVQTPNTSTLRNWSPCNIFIGFNLLD
jgi:hypothetical protein